ncbi:peptidylprolyl isomerase [Ideonella sp. A 288]|uniref:peptidylprolyl isomerase n=1 Tax=Ideonella sp. A 288 TaxID=1962181 RepID=UPI000B4ADF4A|nr:peptidylprolyl isomerase [Ideonella sp. A 288]
MKHLNLSAGPRYRNVGRIAARGLLTLCLGVALAGPALAQKQYAARVNGIFIEMESVDRQFEILLAERRIHIARLQDPNKAKAIKREALDNLIRVELLWQEAKTAGLAATDAEVDRALAEVRKGFRSHEAFVRRIEAQGFTEKTHREHTRKMMSGDRYAQRIVDREVKVTDQDIEEFYDLNARLFKRKEQVKVRQILVALPKQPTPEQKAAARTKIDGLLAKVRAGEDFEALARHNSDDATRQWGGELDPFSRGEQSGPFEEAAFALKTGAVSDVIETGAGLHIVKLEERIEAVTVPLDKARDRIVEHLTRTRAKDALDKEVEQLRAVGKVEVLTPL